MKHLLISLILSCFAICGFAQEHLSFKGIPITGSMTSFCQKLKAKGFTQIGSESNIRLFKGDFTGRQATVGVGAADNGRDVFTVVVFFDPSGEWNTLTSTYNYYKELYSEKYGQPSVCIEENPARGEENISKMAAVHEGTVTWGAVFNAPGGTIELSIEKSTGVYEGYFLIRYRDEQNVNAKRQSDLDDI